MWLFPSSVMPSGSGNAQFYSLTFKIVLSFGFPSHFYPVHSNQVDSKLYV